MLKKLCQLRDGEIRLVDFAGEHVFGPAPGADALRTTIHIHDPRVYARLVFGGSIAAGETFERGEWTCDDLPALCRIVLRNAHVFDALDGWCSSAARWADRFAHLFRPNSRGGSRQNITAHYDLGNDFFQEILDPTLMYSCGLFADDHGDLEDASLAKLDAVCRKLDLRPGDRVLEIGTGWGGFACHAARHYGSRITTTTISPRQYDFARRRVEQEGLSNRVEVLRDDYRNLKGAYDKIVSIEMLEAVGEAYLDTFLKQCQKLLRPAGAMFLQFITIADEHFDRYRRSVDYIQQSIFPGGFLPSLADLQGRIRDATDFRVERIDELGLHYAITLRRWRENLFRRATRLMRLGYSEALVRRFDYYFAYCEAGFLERRTNLVHMVLNRRELERRDGSCPPLRRFAAALGTSRHSNRSDSLE